MIEEGSEEEEKEGEDESEVKIWWVGGERVRESKKEKKSGEY